MNLPRSSGTALGAPSPSGITVYHSWSPPLFFWVPVGGGGGGYPGGGFGWIVVLVLVVGVILFLFLRRRVPADGAYDSDEEELEVLYARCRKNLDQLTVTYVDAQTWLERLEGKIPGAQWKDWNDKYTRIQLDDFEAQLKAIRHDLDQGRSIAARAALFSFDEDAVAVFEFFRQMENTLEELG